MKKIIYITILLSLNVSASFNDFKPFEPIVFEDITNYLDGVTCECKSHERQFYSLERIKVSRNVNGSQTQRVVYSVGLSKRSCEEKLEQMKKCDFKATE